MGSRGTAAYALSTKQQAAVNKFAKQTANLKNEQYRIIDENGNVLVKAQGKTHEVGVKLGVKRDNLPANVSLHNHPSGGTFSPDDLSEFGIGAKEIVVSSPEGVYRLTNLKFGTKDAYSGWLAMRDAYQNDVPQDVSFVALNRQASANLANSPTTQQLNAITNRFGQIRNDQGPAAAQEYFNSVRAKYDALQDARKQELAAERRRLETKPAHDFFVANAKKYGFKYTFTKWK